MYTTCSFSEISNNVSARAYDLAGYRFLDRLAVPNWIPSLKGASNLIKEQLVPPFLTCHCCASANLFPSWLVVQCTGLHLHQSLRGNCCLAAGPVRASHQGRNSLFVPAWFRSLVSKAWGEREGLVLLSNRRLWQIPVLFWGDLSGLPDHREGALVLLQDFHGINCSFWEQLYSPCNILTFKLFFIS